jgi:hypothetical protein
MASSSDGKKKKIKGFWTNVKLKVHLHLNNKKDILHVHLHLNKIYTNYKVSKTYD